jgi:gas vesicle protein
LLETLAEWITWENVKALSNSSFTTSLIGALAGAFAGAIAAQRIAERSKLREELSKEIRNTNAGITLALTVANTMLSLKKQHTHGIKSTYDLEKKKCLDFLENNVKTNSTINETYTFTGDLRTLPELSPPIITLEEIVFSRLSATGRPLSLAASIVSAVQSLNNSILQRNELTKLFKEQSFPQGASLHAMYFGLPYGDGHRNQEFGDTIEAISLYTDDVIFFCILLCEDLRKHGLRTSLTYKQKINKESPKVIEAKFETHEQNELIPKNENYPTWFSAFQPSKEKKLPWWKFTLKDKP